MYLHSSCSVATVYSQKYLLSHSILYESQIHYYVLYQQIIEGRIHNYLIKQ